MIPLFFVLVALGSTLSVPFGVTVVLLNCCTLHLPFFYLVLPGMGGVLAADCALVGLLAGILVRRSYRLQMQSAWLWATVGWFIICAAIHFVSGNSANLPSPESLAYNLVIRNGFLWVLPLAIRGATKKEQELTFKLMFPIILLAAAVAIYPQVTGDLGFVLQYYPTYAMAQTDMTANLALIIQAGDIPKIVPPGIHLCAIGFLMAFAGFIESGRHQFIRFFCMGTVTAACGFVLVGFRSKSLFVATVLAVIWGIVYTWARDVSSRIYGAITLVLILVGTIWLEGRSGFDFVAQTMQRLDSEMTLESGSMGVRLQDNLDAWNLIVETPIIGLGTSSFEWLCYVQDEYNQIIGGYDAHALLMLALLAGVPASLLAVGAITQTVWKVPWTKLWMLPWEVRGLALGFAITLLLAAVNSMPLFNQQKLFVPFAVCWGLLEGYLMRHKESLSVRREKLVMFPIAEPKGELVRT